MSLWWTVNLFQVVKQLLLTTNSMVKWKETVKLSSCCDIFRSKFWASVTKWLLGSFIIISRNISSFISACIVIGDGNDLALSLVRRRVSSAAEAIFGLIKLLTQTDCFSLFCVKFISRSRTLFVWRINTDRRCGKRLKKIPVTFCQTEKMFHFGENWGSRRLGLSWGGRGCYSFWGLKLSDLGQEIGWNWSLFFYRNWNNYRTLGRSQVFHSLVDV